MEPRYTEAEIKACQDWVANKVKEIEGRIEHLHIIEYKEVYANHESLSQDYNKLREVAENMRIKLETERSKLSILNHTLDELHKSIERYNGLIEDQRFYDLILFNIKDEKEFEEAIKLQEKP